MEAVMKSIAQVLVLCLTIAAAPVQHVDLRKAAQAPISHSRSGAIKGAIIGFPIGVLAGVTIGAEACMGKPKWHCAVGGGLTWSGIGALIGWLH
jgi:hypothetical protein